MRYFVLLALVFSGCATPGYHVTDAHDAWINVHSAWIGDTLYYCHATQGPVEATPTCYKPRMIDDNARHPASYPID